MAIVLGLAASAGCRSTPAPQSPQPGGTLRVAVFEPFDIPSPLYVRRGTTAELLEHITPPLGRIDEQGTVRLLLANDCTDRGAHIDFTLRPARWEDGRPVRPEDFAATAALLANTRLQCLDRARTDLLRGTRVLDGQTLRLEFATIYGRRVRDALLMPVPAHRVPAAPLDAPVRDAAWVLEPLACGPYRLAVSEANRMLLVRRTAPGFTPAQIESVEVRTRDPEGALADYARGAVDVLVDLPAGFVRDAARRRGTRTVALLGESSVFVGWNLRDGRFADPAVRRAAAHAVDVEALLRAATAGQGERSRGPLTALAGFADTTAVLGFDRAAAERQLDAAGWRDHDADGVRDRGGAELAFHILVPADNAQRVAVAEAVARDLGRVGMSVAVRAVPLASFLARLERRAFEAYVGEWFPDPGLDLEPIWRSDATDRFNFGGYASPTADSLLTRLQHELLPDERARVLGRFQARVYADQPCLFLFQNPHFVLFAAAVRGAEPHVASPFWNLPEWWLDRSRSP